MPGPSGCSYAETHLRRPGGRSGAPAAGTLAANYTHRGPSRSRTGSSSTCRSWPGGPDGTPSERRRGLPPPPPAALRSASPPSTSTAWTTSSWPIPQVSDALVRIVPRFDVVAVQGRPLEEPRRAGAAGRADQRHRPLLRFRHLPDPGPQPVEQYNALLFDLTHGRGRPRDGPLGRGSGRPVPHQAAGGVVPRAGPAGERGLHLHAGQRAGRSRPGGRRVGPAGRRVPRRADDDRPQRRRHHPAGRPGGRPRAPGPAGPGAQPRRPPSPACPPPPAAPVWPTTSSSTAAPRSSTPAGPACWTSSASCDLTPQAALEVSEHLPVWAEFSAYENGQAGHVPNP